MVENAPLLTIKSILVNMPKKYTETEKENIRKALLREGGECLRLYGVKKTTVDELVRRVDIPKGTFYLFYEHKEALFLDMITTFISELENLYLMKLQELDENHIVTSLTDIFFTILWKFYTDGLYRFLDGNELELVLRKYGNVERDKLKGSFRPILESLFSYFSIEDENDINSFAKGYEALLYILLHVDKIENKESTLRFLIRGLVLQMVE